MEKGYINGSDMLLYVGDKAVGHCTSHKCTYNSETKDHAVKPVATAAAGAGLWKEKTVSGLSIQVSTEGLAFYNETEYGFPDLLKAWKSGEPVTLKCARRAKATTPYLQGSFIISSVEENNPANDDVTYSANFENSGEPDKFDTAALTSTNAA